MPEGEEVEARPPAPRLVAVDGNGTLLGADGSSVSEYTRDVIARVQALDIPVVLVTGRPFEKALPTLEKAGMQRYVITENGTRAIRVEDGQALYELWLDGAEAVAPIKRIKEALPCKCFFAQITKDGGLIEEAHPWLSSAETAAPARRFFACAVADLAEELQAGRQCAKSYVCVPESQDFDATMAEVKAAAGQGWEVRQIKQLLPGIANTCEVQSSSVNKADGLAGLCKAIGIQMENVWAFGDDLNDVRMLREVGWGVRMVNHTPALNGIGMDVTARSNEEDGVAEYLQRCLLDSSESAA